MSRTYEYYDSAIYDVTDTAFSDQDEECSIGFILYYVEGEQDRYIGVYYGDGESTYDEHRCDTWQDAYDFVIKTYEDTTGV